MPTSSNKSSHNLRRRAEDLFRVNGVSHEPVVGEEAMSDKPSLEEVHRIKHELHVHHIELEMQNEELRHSKDELEALKNRYFDLYDLAPVGCSMPVMNGYEATAIIRDQKSKVRNHAIPIIALTANAQRVYRDKCLAVGMNDYLSKPVLIPELFSKIEKWSAIEPTPSVALLN